MARDFSSADALLAPPSSDGVLGSLGASSNRRSSCTLRMTTTFPVAGAACEASAPGLASLTSLRPTAQPAVIIAAATIAPNAPALIRIISSSLLLGDQCERAAFWILWKPCNAPGSATAPGADCCAARTD